MSANQTTVSIVIPTVGRPSLERAIRSVLSQSRVPDEIVIVDNGPGLRQEATRLLATTLSCSYHSLPPFSGPGMSRNFGAWLSSSEYILFLDDDDWLSEEYVERFVRQMHSAQADLAFSGKRRFPLSGETPSDGEGSLVQSDAWLQELLRGSNPGVGGTNLGVCRSSFFAVGGFPVDLKSAEDRFFVLRALRSGQRLNVIDGLSVNVSDSGDDRASGRFSNWHDELKLISDNWGCMNFWQRIRVSLRFIYVVLRLRMDERCRGRSRTD